MTEEPDTIPAEELATYDPDGEVAPNPYVQEDPDGEPPVTDQDPEAGAS